MPTDYTVDDPLDPAELATLVSAALPQTQVTGIERAGQGSTNLIYRIQTKQSPLILKISHRPDRIAGQILAKEARMLRELNGAVAELAFGSEIGSFETVNFFSVSCLSGLISREALRSFWPNEAISGRNAIRLQSLNAPDLGIPIPQILWEGTTVQNQPAIILSHLSGTPIRALLDAGIAAEDAMITLGRFNATLNDRHHPKIDEFEVGRPQFARFDQCVNYWLKHWQPLLDAATSTHVSRAQLDAARDRIRQALPFFDDQEWSYVHADLSAENVLGEVRNNQVVLTGVCDFETVQTGPAEYDLASAWNNYFVHYPDLEAPFMTGYRAIRSLHPQWQQRLAAASLFRALRYIKRSVKYQEVHYYDHDRQFLEAWLNR